jgi:uncharacterized protein
MHNGRMERIYSDIIIEQFAQHDQMVFLAGPRQVGKTTISRSIADDNSVFIYLTWDDSADLSTVFRTKVLGCFV